MYTIFFRIPIWQASDLSIKIFLPTKNNDFHMKFYSPKKNETNFSGQIFVRISIILFNGGYFFTLIKKL